MVGAVTAYQPFGFERATSMNEPRGFLKFA